LGRLVHLEHEKQRLIDFPEIQGVEQILNVALFLGTKGLHLFISRVELVLEFVDEVFDSTGEEVHSGDHAVVQVIEFEV
jgi:hypothetical protein